MHCLNEKVLVHLIQIKRLNILRIIQMVFYLFEHRFQIYVKSIIHRHTDNENCFTL